MKRKRPHRFGAVGAVLFLVLVAAPAAVRWFEHADRAPAGPALLDATRQALRIGELEDSVRRLAQALERASGLHDDEASWVRERGRFRAFPVDVLPFGDPSPLRRSLWVVPLRTGKSMSAGAWTDPSSIGNLSTSEIELDEGAAVLWGHAVIGRLETALPGVPAARVRTLRDPGFRVKFRAKNVLGILHGGAGAGDEKLPLLEAHHLTPLVDLADGAEVVTAGGDGVFPPGLLIGHVVARADQTSGAVPIVRAAVDPGELEEAVVIIDVVKGRFRTASDGG